MASKKVRRPTLSAAPGTTGLVYGQPKGNLSGDVIQRTVPANRSPTLSGAVPGDTLTPTSGPTTYGVRQTNTTSNARKGQKFRTFTRMDRPGMTYHEYIIDGKRRVVGVKTKT